MSAQFMRRNIRISVRLTEEEHRLLKEKMARIGVTNQEAFLRKMALDGLVIKLDLPELKQMISLLRYTKRCALKSIRSATTSTRSPNGSTRAAEPTTPTLRRFWKSRSSYGDLPTKFL